MTKNADAPNASQTKKARPTRNFPSAPFSESLQFAADVARVSGGKSVRRLTLFDEIGKSPTSSASQSLLSNSLKYGLTTGSYKAEFIELTPLGEKCVSEALTVRERERAKLEAAITTVELFSQIYEAFVDLKLPARSVMIDKARELGTHEDLAEEAVDTLIVNMRDVGLLQTLAGAERIVSFDMRLDDLPSNSEASKPHISAETDQPKSFSQPTAVITSTQADFETTAFYVSPIGQEGSDQRKHADLFSSSIVEPALHQSKLKLVRADQIDSPGVITRQILDYIIHSRLVIADLSFNNPNVFYELAIRHLMRKPTVQIIRASDRIPFDINQSRTIQIDDSNIYTLVPQLPVYISTIATQVRQALENPDAVDNPISIYFPALTASVRD
ncbi:hypothetical protein HKCCE4037_18645 [Rhodobacterales bacterium HKCCE4037]|nr:hypothetical protein [Rhodobacterales bacterium HKCCE4037]